MVINGGQWTSQVEYSQRLGGRKIHFLTINNCRELFVLTLSADLA